MFILKVENTEKAGHDVKPRLPVKMCTLTSVVRSQHAIGQTIDNRINRMDWKQPNFWCPFRRAVTWYSVIGGNKKRDEYCCSCSNVSSVNMASGIVRAGF